MRAVTPIAIAAGLCAVVVAFSFGVFQIVSGSDTEGPQPQAAQHTSTGKMVQCSAGGEVQTIYTEMGDRFTVTGLLASQENGGLLVRGPEGYLHLAFTDGTVSEGPYVSGEPVNVTGYLRDDGRIEATYVRPACTADLIANVTPGPTAAAPPASEPPATPAQATLQTPVPSSVATPNEVDEDDDDRHDGDHDDDVDGDGDDDDRPRDDDDDAAGTDDNSEMGDVTFRGGDHGNSHGDGDSGQRGNGHSKNKKPNSSLTSQGDVRHAGHVWTKHFWHLYRSVR